jgi:hypothetical protein
VTSDADIPLLISAVRLFPPQLVRSVRQPPSRAAVSASELVLISRRAQGLPDRITDPAVISRLAVLLGKSPDEDHATTP